MAVARNLTLALALVTLACLLAWYAGCNRAPASSSGNMKTISVVIGGETFELEPAVDEQSRQRGLMLRTNIPDQGGMLFVFPDKEIQVQHFWMGHCLVDMDIIYLDSHGRITATHRMKAEPPQRPDESDAEYDRRMRRYSSAYPAQFAIELKAGSLDRLNLKVEDRIPLDLDRLKAMTR